MRFVVGSIRRLTHGCPAGWKLTRAASEGPDEEVGRHLTTCDACFQELAALVDVGVLAEIAIPESEPMSESSRKAISRDLLAAAPVAVAARVPRIRRLAVGAVVAILTVCAAIWFVRPSLPRPRPERTAHFRNQASLVSIRAVDQARFSRTQSAPDEMVRLDDGSIDLHVKSLAGHERFRVFTTDAEVEVRGTRFRVTAHEGHLVAVHVWEGRVEVRPFRGGIAVLEPGDEWESSTSNRADNQLPSGTVARTVPANAKQGESVTRRRTQPLSATTDQRARGTFARAWALLRQGDFRGAAVGFGEAEIVARGSPLEEDALYWRAVATARLKDQRATELFASFLERFPSSPRTSDVRLALGWLRLKAGNPQEARRLFLDALHHASPETAASAREGLRRASQ